MTTNSSAIRPALLPGLLFISALAYTGLALVLHNWPALTFLGKWSVL